jgi:hypothetical protein
MKYVELYKPGTTKTQMVEPDQVQRYRTYGWVPRDTVHEASAVVYPVKKKTAKRHRFIVNSICTTTLKRSKNTVKKMLYA